MNEYEYINEYNIMNMNIKMNINKNKMNIKMNNEYEKMNMNR